MLMLLLKLSLFFNLVVHQTSECCQLELELSLHSCDSQPSHVLFFIKSWSHLARIRVAIDYLSPNMMVIMLYRLLLALCEAFL